MTALSTTAPDLAPAAVEALVRRLYGIEGSTRPLAGERDQNCLMQASDGCRYVFKISNPSEPAEVVDFQIAALDHIARVSPDQPVPRVVRTLEGHTHSTIALAEGVQTRVRMLTYLDGIQIRETERTVAQRRAMGSGLAGLNRALHGFAHPGAAHDLLWNVATAHRLTEQLDSLVDDQRRALAQAFMTRFTTHVLPRLASLRSQVIHNDYHLYNVLVAPDDQARIVGIIDFGDMVHAPLVGEVATAAAFHAAGSADPFEGPAQFVAAYHAVLPLADAEQEVDCRPHGDAPPHHGADLRVARRALPREPRIHHATQPRGVGGPVPDGRPVPQHSTRPAAGRRTNWSHINEKHDRPQHGQRLYPGPRRREPGHRRDDRAPRRLARPGLPPDVRAAAAHRAGRRRLADRPAGAPLSRRLQQRHVARALPPGGDRGDLPAGADAGHQYALSPRLDSRAGRAPARERVGDPAGPPDVDLHGQRGQRPRLSHCEGPHRWHRRDRDRHRVSRHHRHRLEILALAGRDRRSGRACAPGAGAAPVSRRGRRPCPSASRATSRRRSPTCSAMASSRPR